MPIITNFPAPIQVNFAGGNFGAPPPPGVLASAPVRSALWTANRKSEYNHPPVITLENISKQYAGRYLLRDLSLRIGYDERLVVVGSNGAGKSTLMKMILGTVEPDAGRIHLSRSHTAGYLPQDGVVHSGRTLVAEAATAFEELLELHDRAGAITGEIDELVAAGRGDSPAVNQLAAELGKVQHQLEHGEGWSIDAKVKEILSGLGFRPRDFERPTEEFSGGWQMRLALAKLLLRKPTILMLDEPTNHLDIESLQWVEEYLKSYDGSIVLISHDRRFLDAIARRTIELSRGKVAEYKGNYSYYLREKEVRDELLRARYENEQEKVRATMKFVERFRYKSTKARQVQSRLKMLGKVERVELDDEEGGIAFDFPIPPSPGRVVMKLRGLRKDYGDLTVFSDFDLTLERGDRVAFLGVNGAGKSTLARILAGIEPFQKGERRPGHNVSISYYAQHRAEELDPGKTALETLEEAAAVGVQTRLRSLLGCFLFSGDDVFKRVAVLSGGEKSRLALAKMLLQPANLLILDEPTNHLDLRSKGVLQEALRRFPGTYVLVSHDRDFLEPLVTKVVEFSEGGVRPFLGGVSEYLEKVREERNLEAAPEEGKVSTRTPARVARESKRAAAERRQERSRRIRPLKTALAKFEKEINLAEERKKEVEEALASDATYRNSDQARSLSYEYRELTTSLAYLLDEWTKCQEELEGLEA